MRSLPALAVATLLILPTTAAAQGPVAAATGCSKDVLTLDGTAIAVTLCGTSTAGGTTVAETFAAGSASVAKSLAVAGTGAATVRAVDDVSLERLGLKRSLHLTLAVHGTSVTLERALALPGAQILK